MRGLRKTERIGIVDAANRLRNLLPCEFGKDEDFQNGVKRVMTEYLNIIKSIDDTQFDDLIKICRLKVKTLTKQKFCNFAICVAEAMQGIIATYLDGNPAEAYTQLSNLFNHNKVKKRAPAKGYKYLSKYLNESFVTLFGHDTTEWPFLYRIRIGKDIPKEEMWHVPFDSREKVGTYRFSIPGWPAFYIGTSVDACWEEVKRELGPEENIYIATLKTNINWMPFSLQIPPEFVSISNLVQAIYLYYFISTFPVVAVSLIKVRDPAGAFKPEYIIPQMILQYVKTNGIYNFNGIIYSSTKCKTYAERPNLNIVIPTTKTSENKYSDLITDIFEIVDFKCLNGGNILKQLHTVQNMYNITI